MLEEKIDDDDDIDLEFNKDEYESIEQLTELIDKEISRETPMQRTSQSIARSVREMASGTSTGEYPALEAIIGKQPQRHLDMYTMPKPEKVNGKVAQPDAKEGSTLPETPTQPPAPPPAAYNIQVTVHAGAFSLSLLALFFSTITVIMAAYIYFIK